MDAAVVAADLADPAAPAALMVVALGLGYVLDARVLNRSWRLPAQAPRGLWGAPLLGLVFVAYLVKKDFPLSSLPVIGKRFKKQ